MYFYFENDNLCLNLENGRVIKNITASVEYLGCHYDTIIVNNKKWDTSKLGETLIATDGVFTIEVSTGKECPIIKGKFNVDEDISIVNFCFFKGQINATFDKLYSNAGTCFNGVKTNDMSSYVSVEGFVKNQRKESVDYAVAINDDACILAGAITFAKNHSSVEFCQNGGIMLIAPMFYKPVNKGDVILSDDFIVGESNSLNGALSLYGQALYCVSDKPLALSPAYSGWCSWYYYGSNISEDVIIENMTALKNNGVMVDVIQIDDGWSVSRGEWQANSKFPHGMKWLAERIKKEGYIPGIWVSPLTADENSEFFKNNKDIFVKDRCSDEVYGYRSIDMSTQKAQKYLYDLFYKLSHEWGFRYIKYDFAIYGISSGRHSDSNFNGVKNYEKALEIMRSAVTEDTFLLACTSPISQPINYVNGIRTSMDIFEQWNSLKAVSRQVYLRSFLNDFVRVDPDCVMVRTAQNEDDQAFRLCTRTEKEIETFVSFIASTGGATMFSDKVTLLGEKQIQLYKALLPVNQFTGKLLDIGIRDIPSEVLIDAGFVKTVMLFNWEDYSEVMSVDLDKEYNVFDFWDKKSIGKHKTLSFEVQPHQVKVLQCVEKVDLGFLERIAPNINATTVDGKIVINDLKDGETLLIDGKKVVSQLGKIEILLK